MGQCKIKGKLDVELTVDAMELAPRLDHIVLFSGDGAFRPLVASLQRQGVRVTVASTMRSQADDFIEMDVLKSLISRPARSVLDDVHDVSVTSTD